MEKELLEFTKKQKISNSKDNKQKTLKVINRTIKKRMSANIAQHYNTFTQKKNSTKIFI
jgi:hypothetical protein